MTKESDIFRIMSFNTYKWHSAINEENFIKQLEYKEKYSKNTNRK